MKITEAYTVYNNNLKTMDPALAEAVDHILTDANQRIEQIEETLHAVKDFSGEYAPFNSAMAKIQKMAEEGLQ